MLIMHNDRPQGDGTSPGPNEHSESRLQTDGHEFAQWLAKTEQFGSNRPPLATQGWTGKYPPGDYDSF